MEQGGEQAFLLPPGFTEMHLQHLFGIFKCIQIFNRKAGFTFTRAPSAGAHTAAFTMSLVLLPHI